MTSKPDALLPSAKDVMAKIALAEAEEAEKEARAQAEAKAEKKALIDQLSKPSGISEEEAIRRAITIIERAIQNRINEVEVLRFPNQLCTDKGRAINQQEPGWEKTLTGSPKEIYQLWDRYFRPRGYKLKVQIVDFPDGLPGDIGMTLSWENGDSNEQETNARTQGTVVIRYVRNRRPGDGLRHRRSPAHDSVLGCPAPAREPIPRAYGRDGAACAQLRG